MGGWGGGGVGLVGVYGRREDEVENASSFKKGISAPPFFCSSQCALYVLYFTFDIECCM